MSIDTETKRRSVQAYTFGLMRPLADGTIDSGDRASAAWLYSGLSYAPFVPPPVVVTPSTAKRPGPYPGAYTQRYYLPPGWAKKRPEVVEVKELYIAARKEIPPREQKGLLARRFRLEGSSVARLPPTRLVDFDALRDDLQALGRLFEALSKHRDDLREAEIESILKRRKDEEILIRLLLEIL